jgi:prolyl oligopeptidase
MIKSVVFLCVLGMLVAPVGAHASEESDPHLWLEEIDGARALDWVRAENSRSLAVLESEPAFESLREDALAILTSEERIPLGQIRDGHVYNFWQDATHVRGLWRRASVESYRSGAPEWEILIDYDALARTQERNWIRGQVSCLAPQYRHCMVQLSDGGTDAAYWREFDTSTASFVNDGFSLPEAKSSVAWIDEDTLLIGMDTGEGSLTSSGYARILRVWTRGQDFREAPIFVEGAESDVAVWPRVEQDDGRAHLFGQQAESFFESKYHYASSVDGELRVLPLPPNADLEGVLDGRAIFTLRETWAHGQREYEQGSVVAYELASDTSSPSNVVMGRSGTVGPAGAASRPVSAPASPSVSACPAHATATTASPATVARQRWRRRVCTGDLGVRRVSRWNRAGTGRLPRRHPGGSKDGRKVFPRGTTTRRSPACVLLRPCCAPRRWSGSPRCAS